MNIKELSSHLGISVSTISKALNGYGGVSAETKERVEKAAREFGYYPQASARSLRRRNTDRIGLLDPLIGGNDWEQDVLGTYFLRMLRGIVNESEKTHKDLMVYTTQPMKDPMGIKKIITSRDVDGLIVFGRTMSTEDIAMIKKYALPFILFGKVVDDTDLSFVVPDMEQAGYLATRHLIEQGFSHIGYMGQEKDYQVNQRYYTGYVRALRESGIEPDASLYVSAEFELNGGAEAFEQLMSQAPQVDSMVFFSDGLYFEALPIINKYKNHGTWNFGCVGMTDTDRARWSEPGLSSIQIPLKEMGEEAVRLLLQLIADGAKTPQQKIVPVKLIERASSRR